MARWRAIRRKVFISFYGVDESEVLDFVSWADSQGVLIPRLLHESYTGDFVNSTNTEYVMDIIRRRYLQDTTITLLLMGTCTHSRRYVDWELKASLRQGEVYIPNGLLAISLPSAPQKLFLPPRFQDNWQRDGSGYAQWHGPPQNAEQLADWIEDAYAARRSRPHLIRNGRGMMRYNAKCRYCGRNHTSG